MAKGKKADGTTYGSEHVYDMQYYKKKREADGTLSFSEQARDFDHYRKKEGKRQPAPSAAEERGLFGFDLFGEPVRQAKDSPLKERFIIPPFSVLDARSGDWQERKRAWINLGLRGEWGRGGEGPGRCFGQDLVKGENAKFGTVGGKNASGTNRATDYDYGGGEDAWGGAATSVFDPVLCELAYTWFCPPGGHVLDPFAGEATKGVVAAFLGYRYTGVELRQEQVEVNRYQAERIGVAPTWIQGDSSALEAALPAGEEYDFVWTSPPYYDLEIYSKSEKDGSAFATYDRFMAWYRWIFSQAVARLRPNRFVAVKVGEIRDERGAYRGFVPDNIRCFTDLGLHYYNEAILVTAIGSLPVRVGKQFSRGRKIGKTHQNVLVFFKGDPRRIKDEFPELR